MNTSNYTLTAVITLLTLTTAPVLTSCAGSKQISPQAEQAVLRLKEAAESIGVEGNACVVFINKLKDLSESAGPECREVLRQARARMGGV